MKFTAIYNSSGIHVCIKRLFGNPNPSDRRVAIVAYVGTDGELYLPQPENLHVICSPSAGATDPNVIRSLRKRGAKVQFSDNLHMKVYWSKHRGCLITSANASSSALGKNGLKEAGVLLPPRSVDIGKLIKYANPREVTVKELRRLDRESREVAKGRSRTSIRGQSIAGFLDWYGLPDPSTWKLAWCDYELAGAAESTKEKTFVEYGLLKPNTWVCAAKGNFKTNDWLLVFTFAKNGIENMHWIFVDFLVETGNKDKRFYFEEWPLHAVQVHPVSKYPPPPFKITPAFRKAFRRAVDRYSAERIKDSDSVIPPRRLLSHVAEFLQERQANGHD